MAASAAAATASVLAAMAKQTQSKANQANLLAKQNDGAPKSYPLRICIGATRRETWSVGRWAISIVCQSICLSISRFVSLSVSLSVTVPVDLSVAKFRSWCVANEPRGLFFHQF